MVHLYIYGVLYTELGVMFCRSGLGFDRYWQSLGVYIEMSVEAGSILQI